MSTNWRASCTFARLGFEDRFFTIDGDLHTTPFGVECFDVVIFSNIAHQETPEQCRELLRRIYRALRSEGRVVVSDLILNDDRSGPKLPLMFNSEMLVNTAGGASYRECEYRQWLSEARFRNLKHEATGGPFALIYASK